MTVKVYCAEIAFSIPSPSYSHQFIAIPLSNSIPMDIESMKCFPFFPISSPSDGTNASKCRRIIKWEISTVNVKY